MKNIYKMGYFEDIRVESQEGDGGKIILWSDEKTGFYGSLSAQGGPLGGDGGFAEVSDNTVTIMAEVAPLEADG